MQRQYPQVALFGSISGNWREDYVIPLLTRLGVSYYHPGIADQQWTQVMGLREVDAMANAETIVMVINHSTPGFGGLAEAGWAALSATQRGQTFILYIPTGYKFEGEGLQAMFGKKYVEMIDDYAGRTRYLVNEHAKRSREVVNGLYVAESIEGVLDILEQQYTSAG
ncbi:MAG: hypothetical protein Phog2KO_38710 [Phototrophicaceae bacterium]